MEVSVISRLPVLRTSFVGRDQELEALNQLLRRDDVPLVTLTGPSGVGKSRLSLRLAMDLSDRFEDRIWFVPLSYVASPDLVLSEIARVVGIRDVGDLSLFESLALSFAHHPSLLIIDNFEHVLPAAPVIAELIASSSSLQILVTSRAVLNLTGESEYRLSPLRTLARYESIDPEYVSQSDAVSLFVQRAQQARPDFAVTEANAATIAEICRRLDGLPLAIELAAARIKVQTPQDLLNRLDHSLHVLTGGARDLPPRMQSMRDAIAWSYNLLTPAQQCLFRRLSVLPGSWTIDTAAAINGSPGGNDLELLETLAGLINNSIAFRQAPESAEPRYRTLITMRQFGREQLHLLDEMESTYRQLLDWAIASTAAGSQFAERNLDSHFLRSVEQDLPNIRGALDWAADNDPTSGLQLAVNIWWVLQNAGLLSEGIGIFNRLIPLASDSLASLKVEALFGLTFLAAIRGDADQSIQAAQEGSALATTTDDVELIGRMHLVSSMAEGCRGDQIAAAIEARKSLDIFRESDNLYWLPFALNRLGIEVADSPSRLEQRRLFTEAFERWKVFGHDWGVITAAVNLAFVARERNEPATAIAALTEALPVALQHGDKWGSVEGLAVLAGIASDQREYERATMLFAAVDQLRETIGLRVQPYLQRELERFEVARQTISTADFERWRTIGKEMELSEVVSLALMQRTNADQSATSQGTAAPDVSDAPRAPATNLTSRETEVLQLLAEGMTSRDIGQALFISPRTASTHIANIYGKLGVDTRAAAVTRAFQLGVL